MAPLRCLSKQGKLAPWLAALLDGRAHPIGALARHAGSTATSGSISRAKELRFARTCYDHLAGVVGVRVTGALLDRRWLRARDDSFTPAPALLTWLADHGQPVVDDPRVRRPLARACLDWSERTPHLAGRLGAAIADLALAAQWLVRARDSRALRLTARGRTALFDELALPTSLCADCQSASRVRTRRRVANRHVRSRAGRRAVRRARPQS